MKRKIVFFLLEDIKNLEFIVTILGVLDQFFMTIL
jgi:hypothetical protein